jgi:hypothetical protein
MKMKLFANLAQTITIVIVENLNPYANVALLTLFFRECLPYYGGVICYAIAIVGSWATRCLHRMPDPHFTKATDKTPL